MLEMVQHIILCGLLHPFAVPVVDCLTNSNAMYGKTRYPTGVDPIRLAACVPEVYDLQRLNVPLNVTCSSLCLRSSPCKSFQFTESDGKCDLLSYEVTLSDRSLPGQNLYYYSTPVNIYGPDLARSKNVVSTTYPGYADPSTTVSGMACGKGDYDCWCSYVTADFVLDLGQASTVKRIIISSYEYWPTYVDNLVVNVGNQGNHNDPEFGRANAPASGTKIEILGNAIGRYVTVWRDIVNYSTCFCLIEVYEN